MILACTVFAWSTRVTDGRTDRRTDRRTELRWLRRAIAVPVARKKKGNDDKRNEKKNIDEKKSKQERKIREQSGEA